MFKLYKWLAAGCVVPKRVASPSWALGTAGVPPAVFGVPPNTSRFNDLEDLKQDRKNIAGVICWNV